MDIVFVHTPMASVSISEREGFWKSFDLKYIEAHPKYRIMKTNLWELPHWMLWLAGVLIDNGFNSLKVADFYSNFNGDLEGIDFEAVNNILQKFEADIFLFSPMTANLHFAIQIAEVIKQLYPKSHVIFGGVIATPLHKTIIQNPNVDCIVVDRGEYALPKLLNSIKNGETFNNVGNLTYKGNSGEVISSSIRYPNFPLHSLPNPKINLFPKEAGASLRYIRHVYGLGCPYECSFCTIQTIGQSPSYFPIDKVISQIFDYNNYYGKHHHIYWGDETFTLNKKKTLELCAALKEVGSIHYDCQTRLNCITDINVMKSLYESGCRWVEIGIETFNQESHNLFKHRTKIIDIEDTFKKMKDEGLNVCTFMLNGLPNQTLNDMKYSIDWICDLLERDLVKASYFSNVVPFPGSPFFDTAEKCGIQLHHTSFKYYNEDLPPVFDTKYGTSEEINKVFLEGLKQIAEVTSHNAKLKNELILSQAGSFWKEAHP